MNLRAVSLMLSYVLLISLGIFMALLIYAGLKLMANIEPVQRCEEGTQLIITSSECNEDTLTLNLQNNGRFNIDGLILLYSDKPKREPTNPFLFGGANSELGYYYFDQSLKPGEVSQLSGDRSVPELSTIEKILIKPFVKSETNKPIICNDAIIIQDVVCPVINP